MFIYKLCLWYLSDVFYDIFSSKVKLGSSAMFEGQQSKTGSILEMPLSKPVVICGDVCVDFFHKPPRIGKKVKKSETK